MFTLNKRRWYTVYTTLLVLVAYFLCDPDVGIVQNLPIGGSTLAMVLIAAKGVIYASAVHWTRKALFDYSSADMSALFKKASSTSTGAGLAIVGLSIMVLSITMCFVLVK